MERDESEPRVTQTMSNVNTVTGKAGEIMDKLIELKNTEDARQKARDKTVICGLRLADLDRTKQRSYDIVANKSSIVSYDIVANNNDRWFVLFL